MAIFGNQPMAAESFEAGQMMGNLIQAKSNQTSAQINAMEGVQKAKDEMGVLRGGISSILSQYQTDEKGRPSDGAPKYVHDLYKAVGSEGSINGLSKSQMISALEGYKAGISVEQNKLDVQAKQQAITINGLKINEAQDAEDERKKILFAHRLALEGVGRPETSTGGVGVLSSIGKYAGNIASTMPAPIGIVASGIGTAIGVLKNPSTASPSVAPSVAPSVTTSVTAQTESNGLKYTVPASKQQEMLELEKQRLKALLDAKKTELNAVGKTNGPNYANLNPFTSFGLNPNNPISDAAGIIYNATFNSESSAQRAVRIESEQARLSDQEKKRTVLSGEIAEISNRLKSLSVDVEENPKPEPAKPVGSTVEPVYEERKRLEEESAKLRTILAKGQQDRTNDWFEASDRFKVVSKKLIENYKKVLTPEDALSQAKDKLKEVSSAPEPLTYQEALKSKKLKEFVSAYEKERGVTINKGYDWPSGYTLSSNVDHQKIMQAYKAETGIDIDSMAKNGSATDKDMEDYVQWANDNSREQTRQKLERFGQTNKDAWQYSINNAKRQVELLSKAIKPVQAPTQTQPLPTTAQVSPVPSSIAPAGSTSAPVSRQPVSLQAQRPIPPVTNEPSLKSDDEKIQEEFGMLTSRLRSLGNVPLNWSEDTYRQIRGYPPKVSVVSSNGVTLVGVGGKWEVLKGDKPSIADQIAQEKHAILKSAIRVDGLSTEKWKFTGDIRTTEPNEAGKVKVAVTDTTRAIEAIDRLIELGDTGLWDSLIPSQKSGVIEAITNSVQAAGRTEIAGSGAFSEQDAKKLADIVPSLASVSGAVFRETALAKLKEYRKRMNDKALGLSSAWGFKLEESSNSGLTKEQEAFIRNRYHEYIKQGMDAESAKRAALQDVMGNK